jgi:hypothetical protein
MSGGQAHGQWPERTVAAGARGGRVGAAAVPVQGEGEAERGLTDWSFRFAL